MLVIDHEKWLDQIDVKNRLYVVINDNDVVLDFSRIKPGEDQKARLGNTLNRLNSQIAHYINVTNEKDVGNGHGYYLGTPVKDTNNSLSQFFKTAFSGEQADDQLTYHSDNNTYTLR